MAALTFFCGGARPRLLAVMSCGGVDSELPLVEESIVWPMNCWRFVVLAELRELVSVVVVREESE